MKKWQIYLLVIIIILAVGFFFGAKVAGGLALLGIGNEIRRKKKETKKAKKEANEKEKEYEETKEKNDEKIAKAGGDVEPKTYNNADDARDGINDTLDSDSK